ncbi:MAG: hypothetical protein U0361_02835 [Nitrospiraceae bacterium]
MLLNLQAADRDWRATEDTLAKIRDAGANTFVADLAEGNLYQARSQLDKAVAAFERAAAAKPDAPEPIRAGPHRCPARQLAQAQQRLTQDIARNAQHPFAHGLLGEILILKGAKPCGRRTVASDGAQTGLSTLQTGVTMKLSQRKAAEATGILQRGLDANPRNEELRLLYASHLGENGQLIWPLRNTRRCCSIQVVDGGEQPGLHAGRFPRRCEES